MRLKNKVAFITGAGSGFGKGAAAAYRNLPEGPGIRREAHRVRREAIEHLDGDEIGHDDACGATPVKGLLIEAKRRSLEVCTLDLRNSGDTAGSRDQVVGYGSWMFSEAPG